jgi:hypothetical protein
VNELDQLAFDFGFKAEELWGDSETVDGRARKLTMAMAHRGRLAELLETIEGLRP